MWRFIFLYLAVSLIFSYPPALGAKLLKVAVVDSGLDLSDSRFQGKLCDKGHKDFTGTGIKDTVGHGTHIAGLIALNSPLYGYCLIILKYYDASVSGEANAAKSVLALQEAIAVGADVVNYSSSGDRMDEIEYTTIKNNPSVTFVVAAGNNGRDLTKVPSYPSSYPLKNIVAVGSLQKNGTYRLPSSNYAPFLFWEIGKDLISTLPDNKVGYMSGTSQATAVHTGKLVSEYLGRMK